MIQTNPANLRIALAGSVGSSRLTLETLLRHRANVVGVLELHPRDIAAVSGYQRLNDVAEAAGVPCAGFRNINAPDVAERLRQWDVDLLFVVGLSQMVKPPLLSLPRRGCVGYHPTWLPAGRGRAPVAWLTLDGSPGAATFFLMDEGADSGPILVQEPFFVSDQFYAADVVQAQSQAMCRALDRWLPALLAGDWDPQPQDHSQASYNGKRAPEDGLIDWNKPAAEIHDLIRTASRPHPGAYTYAEDRRLIVWRAEIERSRAVRGVVGRILESADGSRFLVQTGDGLLWLSETQWAEEDESSTPKLRVGRKLGYAAADEVFRLKQEVAGLEQRLAQLEQRVVRSPGP